MPGFVMLVVALQSGGWQCTQVGELWRCEAAVKSRPPVSMTTPQPPSVDSGAPPLTPRALAAPPGSRAVPLPGGSGFSVNSEGASPAPGEKSGATAESTGYQEGEKVPALEQGALPREESRQEPAAQKAEPSSQDRTSKHQAAATTRTPAPDDPAGKRLDVGTPYASAGYVVQVGAYRKRELAETAASRIDYDGLVIAPTVRAGEDWFVLLLGAFSTLKEARAAGEAYEQAHPGGSFWVRTNEDLERVLSN